MDLPFNRSIDQACSDELAQTVKSEGSARFLLALAVSFLLFSAPVQAANTKSEWADSPLPVETQGRLTRAGKLMKSAKYDKAKPIILSALESANDVPKCLAIAQYTEAYAFPMMDVRRQCCNKALSLCNSEEDYLLMALKARKYQFFEVTRDSIHKLIENARTTTQLYNLGRKAQELALNDVSHLAMEKAYTGIKSQDDAFTYVDNAKALGMDDLMRKAIKLLIDDEDESIPLCQIATHIQKYGMRDEVRYALRKALDHTSHDLGAATNEVTEIMETARRLNEPDVKARAEYFMKKGNFMLKQKDLQSEAEAKARAEREKQGLDDARLKDKERESGFTQEERATTKGQSDGANSNASTGY